MLLGGPLTYRTLHFLMIKLCILRVSNTAAIFENMNGTIKVEDVSKSNLGYDIEVQWANRTDYIEVKSVDRLGDSVTLTSNEYSTASDFGEFYALAIVEQDNETINMCLIYDPIRRLSFFKRVTRWEWVCNEYSGKLVKTRLAD